MKKILYAIIASALTLGACHPTYVVEQRSTPTPAPAPEPAPVVQEVSYQNFYDDLSPYGHWIDYPGYGYVWMPAVGPDFRPYSTNGYWVYTDMGWTWTSNYSWGWAPFHYGRWFYEGGYGWMWVPGNEWSPAWVTWRTNSDYYGWAPLGPNVRMDVYAGSYNPPANYWCFVPHQYIANQRVSNYYINESRNVTIINNTTVINTRVVNVNNNNSRVYMNGPDRQEVERYSGTAIRPAVVRDYNRPGEQVNNGQYNVYRPRVNAAATRVSNNQTVRVAPSRVESLRDMRAGGSSANEQAVNNPPVIRNNNNNNSYNNNNNTPPANNNNTVRPAENVPPTVVRQQQSANNNQPVIRNSTNVAPANNNNNNNNVRPNTTTTAPARNVRQQQTVSNNPPANNRVNTPSPTASTRPVNTPTTTGTRPANNNNNNARANSTTNSASQVSQNASHINKMRKANTESGRPVKKDE